MRRNVIYSGNQSGWLLAVAGEVMDGGNKPPSVARLLRIIPGKVGATATNDAHVTAAENGHDRMDLKAGQKIWIEGALKALRDAELVNGDDEALIWLGKEGKDYKVKFGTRGKERFYTVHSAASRQSSRDAYMLGTPEHDPYEQSGFGHDGRVMRGDTDPLKVKVRTRSHGKEYIKEQKFEMHPLALAVPPMTVDEQTVMRASVEKNGVGEAVWLYPDKNDLTVKGNPKLKILDGRHRTYFASVTGQPIETRVFEGDEEAAKEKVVTANLHRRHLTPIQRALVAERLFGVEARQEAARAAQEGNSRGGKSPRNLSETSKRRGREAHQIVRAKAGGDAAGFSEADAKVAAVVVRAPKTAAKVERGETRRTSAAKREAEAETRGEPVRKATAGGAVTYTKSVNEHIGSAMSSLRTAAEAADLPLGKTTPRDTGKRLDEIIELAKKLKAKYAS